MPLRCRKILLLTGIAFGCAVYVLLLACSAARAQYRFDSWTTDDGLPQNSVYSIVQTPDGYIWLTTFDGLVRFDGVHFTVFNKNNTKNLPSNRFIKLFAEADGTLWACTEDNGVARYKDGEFKNFTVHDGLPSNYVVGIQQDADESLLFFARNGIARFRDNRFTVEREGGHRDYKIYLAPSGRRWEINSSGLREFDRDGAEKRYPLPFDAQKISADQTFNYFSFVEMLEDRDGFLWLSAAGNLYKLKDGATIEVLTARNNMPASLVRRLAQDRRGDIWLGMEKDGACRLAANRFVCFGVANGLSSNRIFDIFSDREGTLWLASNDKGFNRATEQIITPLSIADGLTGKNVYPILEDSRGAIWIGSFSGLSEVKNGKATNYRARDGLLYEIVQSLFEDADGRLWIGSVGGVEFLQNGKFYDYTEKLNIAVGDVDFWDIHQDRRGAFWFATNKGLVKYDGSVIAKFDAENGLPDNDVKAILEARDGETLWFGTYGGLARLKNNQFDRFTEKDGLAGNHVRTVYEDAAGAIWIGTYDSGLSRFKDGHFTNYTTNEGLFSNGVFCILEDDSGTFWMSSNQGIYRVSRKDLEDFAAGKIARVNSTAFDKSDGMLSAECNGGRQPAGIKTADGRLWFPTQDGAAIVNPALVAVNLLAPPVAIENVLIESRPAENFLPAIRRQAAIVVSPGQNNLEIAYTGLSFIKPEQIRFRYKLEGLDANWTDAGARRTAYFSYLPPGEYTFRVVAANSDGVWNETGKSLAITVLPPFYRTWWFLILSVLAVSAAAFAVYKTRINRVERARLAQEEFSRRLINAHEAERSRVAAELHDSIGQTLAMIKNRAAFGSQADDKTAKEQLEAIGAQTTQAIGEVREISYNLRPYLLENLGLTKAVKSLVHKIEEVHLLSVDARIDDVDDSFSGEAEMSVYRIIQEGLNNVAKHSEADAARLTIEKRGGIVTIKIEDDGRGFDPAVPKTDAETGGFGLLGIAERVRMLRGALDIQTGNGKGTKLTIKIRAKDG